MATINITSQLPVRSLLLVLVSTFVLIAMGGHLYVLKQPLAALDEARDELFETRRSRPQDMPEPASIGEVEAEIEALQTRLGGGAPNLAPNEMVAFVIGQLDLIARNRGVQLVSVEPGAIARVFEFDEIPFHIEVIGSYFKLVDWLQMAEQQLGPMVIKSFEIEPAPGTGPVVCA